jgi:hypothetical protein
MPRAAHPAPPGGLLLSDHQRALVGAAGSQLARRFLGGVDFVEVVDSPADSARRASFDSKIRILRHYFRFLEADARGVRDAEEIGSLAPSIYCSFFLRFNGPIMKLGSILGWCFEDAEELQV